MNTIKINLFESRWDARYHASGMTGIEHICIEVPLPQKEEEESLRGEYSLRKSIRKNEWSLSLRGETFIGWDENVNGDYVPIITGPSGLSFLRHCGDHEEYEAWLSFELNK